MSSRDPYTKYRKECIISSNITLKHQYSGGIDIVINDKLARRLIKDPGFHFATFCEKFKQFVNSNYDCTFLDAEIAFPILKKLIEASDVKAKSAYKREYVTKISNLVQQSGIKYIKELDYLLGESFVKDYNSGELNEIFNDYNLPIMKSMLKKLKQVEDNNEKWGSRRVLNKIVNVSPNLLDEYISKNVLESNFGLIFNLVKYRILNNITVSNLFKIFEKPDSKLKEFLLSCLKNDDKDIRINAAEIMGKGKQKIFNYLKIKIAESDYHEKIVLIHDLLKNGYYTFFSDENLRNFFENLNQNILNDLIKLAIENFKQLLENRNYESSLIFENHVLPSLRRIVDIYEDNLKKVFDDNIVKLVWEEKFFMNFYLFSGGYLTYLNDTEKTNFLNMLSSKIFDEFEKDLENMDEYEYQILTDGFQNLGVNSIEILFKLLKIDNLGELRDSFADILIDIGKENRELIREEVFNIISTSKYAELSDILYYDKLINLLEKDDLIELLNNPQAKLINKLKIALDDYDSGNYRTAISLLIKMDEYGIETLLKWLKDHYHESFEEQILEFFKSMGKKSVRILHKVITKSIQSNDIEGIFNLIRLDLLKNLPKDVIIEIFWSEDRLITALVNLMEKKSSESLEFINSLKFLCETIGLEADDLLLRVFIHGVVNYLWTEIKYIKDYGLKLIRPLRSEFSNIAHDQRIDSDIFEIFYNILLDNLEEQDLYDLLDDPDIKFIDYE